MIGSLHFTSFKSLRDLRLEGLGQLTVIVGPSGVGKTSVLQGLEVLGEVIEPEGRALDEGPMALPRLQTIGTQSPLALLAFGRDASMELGLYLATEHYELSYATGTERNSVARMLRDRRLIQPTLKQARGELEQAARELREDLPLARHLAGSKVLQFDPTQLGAASQANPRPVLDVRGAGLATVLAYLAGAERDVLEAIETQLRAVLGMTGRLRSFPHELELEEREQLRVDGQLVPRVLRRKVAAHRFELEIDGVGPVPGDLLSEGTLVTLGLLAVLHQPRAPTLILLDDIDRGLHPDAQARLLAALRNLLTERPGLQVLCTSHSPYLVDHVEPEEVQVMSFVDGQVGAARLDRHEEWERWRGKLQTGEFWQSAGEDWISARAVSDGE